MARDRFQDQRLVGAAALENEKAGPNMGRGTSGLKDTLGSAMAQTSMRLGAPKKEAKEEKPKAKKSETKKLKDTSKDYWSADGLSGERGSASGEVGADMSQVNKGGYDASEEGMKRGGKVSEASRRADGCAIRGKTRA